MEIQHFLNQNIKLYYKKLFSWKNNSYFKSNSPRDKHKYFGPYPDGFVYAKDINEAIN